VGYSSKKDLNNNFNSMPNFGVRVKKIDYEKLQEEAEKKAKKRERRKKPKMKVSGSAQKKLQRIIIEKAKH